MLAKSVEHTYQVLRKTDSISFLLNKILASSPDTSLSDLSGLHAQLTDRIHGLKVLVNDNQAQLQRVVLLEKQIEASSQPGNSQKVLVGASQIIKAIADVRQVEEALLLNRKDAYKKTGRQTQLIIVAGSVLILIIVSFLVYIILNELKDRFEAYQKEHELNKLKGNFVTLASHEFRTPLSSILLSAALIEKYMEKGAKEHVVQHLAKIKKVVYNIEGILEDFLSVEQLDADQIKPEFRSFNLPELCMEALNTMRPMASPGQSLIYEPRGKFEMVCLDPTLIKKAIVSLLENALRYAGENVLIRLITRIEGDRILIVIKDNGRGISEEDQKKLSTIFFRVDQSGSIPGTGLGLHIVKRYVQLMNGSFRFSSRLFEDTHFEMSFPTGNTSEEL
jgi:signal transduction histidine kinase